MSFLVVSREGVSVGRSVGRSVWNAFSRRAETKTANDLCRVSGLVPKEFDDDDDYDDDDDDDDDDHDENDDDDDNDEKKLILTRRT